LAESCELQKFPGPQSHLLSGIRPRSTAPFDRFSTIILCAYHIEWVALSSWPHFPLSPLQTASAHTLLIHLAKCNPITSIRLWFPESLIFLLSPDGTCCCCLWKSEPSTWLWLSQLAVGVMHNNDLLRTSSFLTVVLIEEHNPMEPQVALAF